MNIIADLHELNYRISNVRQVISPRAAGAFSGIQLKATAGKLSITGSDGSCTISTCMENVTVLEEGAVLAPVMLAEILAKQPGADIQISVEKNSIVVYGKTATGKKTKSSVSVLEGELKEAEPIQDENLSVNAGKFNAVLNSVQYAIAKDESRAVLTGLYLEVDENSAKVTTLDGYRLSHCSIPSAKLNGGAKGIIPGRTCSLLSKISHAGATDEDIHIQIQNGNITASCAGFTLRSILINGEYVDYSRTIPKESKVVARVKKDDLLQALGRAAVYTSAATNKYLVKLNFSGNSLNISAKAPFGETSDEVDAEINGEDVMIAFNASYLTETVKAVNGEYVNFSIQSSVSPLKVTDGETDKIEIILPVRTFADSSAA